MKIELELCDIEVNRILGMEKAKAQDLPADDMTQIVRAYLGATRTVMAKVLAGVKAQS